MEVGFTWYEIVEKLNIDSQEEWEHTTPSVITLEPKDFVFKMSKSQ